MYITVPLFMRHGSLLLAVAASNAKACYATGRGIQPRGVRVKDNADFYVHTKGAGEGEVSVQIIGPGGGCCVLEFVSL